MKFSDRPEYYKYADMLANYLLEANPDFQPLNGNPVFPRQLEVHVPNKGKKSCNLSCLHCQGKKINKLMAPYDDEILALIDDLDGKIPLFVFSGAYAEPTLNLKLIDFIGHVKATGANFGLHTNGVLLPELEEKISFISRLCQLADGGDYITFSLDAGLRESYARLKCVDPAYFDQAISGIQLLISKRLNINQSTFKVRVTYVLLSTNSDDAEIREIIQLARMMGVDSLRFSIPYAPYGTSYEECLKYKYNRELKFSEKVISTVREYSSTNSLDNPYIFYLPPELQDVENCFTHHCFYGYFQITVGADGYLYRCSSTASPSFMEHRLGKLPDNKINLLNLVKVNQDLSFNPLIRCKPVGARCNRAAIDVNRVFEKKWFPI